MLAAAPVLAAALLAFGCAACTPGRMAGAGDGSTVAAAGAEPVSKGNAHGQ